MSILIDIAPKLPPKSHKMKKIHRDAARMGNIYRAGQKVSPKDFGNFSRTESVNFLYTSCLFNCPHTWKVSLHYLQNLQNYAAFSHDNLAVETLSNIVSVIRKCEHFLSREKCLERLPSQFTYSCQTNCKTRDSFVNSTCGKLSHIFFPVRLLIQKLFWASDGFQIANSCVASMQTCTISPFHSN